VIKLVLQAERRNVEDAVEIITVKVSGKKYSGLQAVVKVTGGADFMELARAEFVKVHPELVTSNWTLKNMTPTGPGTFTAVVKPAGSSHWA
jgi:hypothetical protein